MSGWLWVAGRGDVEGVGGDYPSTSLSRSLTRKSFSFCQY